MLTLYGEIKGQISKFINYYNKITFYISKSQKATGEAVYIDDIPYVEGELYAGLVLSEKAHANILDIDASESLKMDGVIDFVSHT